MHMLLAGRLELMSWVERRGSLPAAFGVLKSLTRGPHAQLFVSVRANPAQQKAIGYPSGVARELLWTYLQQMDRFQIRGRGATYPHADSGGARHETADSHHQEVVSCTRFALL